MADQALIADLPRRLDLHAKWWRGEEDGVRIDLRGANLRSADLSSAVLRGADLSGADLRGADLRGAELRGADLSGADLRSANLRSANLRSADLRSADLTGAVLTDADLRSANLRSADLRIADLTGAVLTDADLPTGYRIASLCFGGWPVTVTPEKTTIGCQTHPNADWLRRTPEDVVDMHPAAAAWWTRHRDAVCEVIRDVMKEGSDV